MKLFPKEKYLIELEKESEVAILKLKTQTLPKEQYVSDWDNQTFIGKVENNKFEVEISNKIYGKFCVLKGKLENKSGILEILTSRILKIITILLILSAISIMITSIIYNKPIDFILGILSILTTKFVFLNLGFKYFSKIGIKKMTEMLEINKIQKA